MNWTTGRNVQRLKRFIPLAVVMVAACDDPFGPAVWDATPDTVVIFSASRPEYLGQASAVDITNNPVVALPIEAPGLTGNWDFALTDLDGGLALVPASAFEGLESRARIGVLRNRTLDEVTQAPRDSTSSAWAPPSAPYGVEPLPIVAGDVYIVRSRRSSCGGVSSGYRYAKLRAVEINVAAGTYTFEIVRNPYCDNRSFIPPEE